jgi:hypothetical protein
VIPLACPLPVPEGLPHAASRNGNTGLFAQAIATGGDTWARVSRSLSAVPPWTILGTPALSQKSYRLCGNSTFRRIHDVQANGSWLRRAGLLLMPGRGGLRVGSRSPCCCD